MSIPSDPASSYNFTTVSTDDPGQTTAILSGLIPYTKYSVVVQVFNSRGPGPTSPPTVTTTLEDSMLYLF